MKKHFQFILEGESFHLQQTKPPRHPTFLPAAVHATSVNQPLRELSANHMQTPCDRPKSVAR